MADCQFIRNFPAQGVADLSFLIKFVLIIKNINQHYVEEASAPLIHHGNEKEYTIACYSRRHWDGTYANGVLLHVQRR